MRSPLDALQRIGARANGEIVRVSLGPFRPYLITRPEHVQHVLHDNVGNYLRDGMMWRPLRRLMGDGIAAEGEEWRRSRRIMQPLFTARQIATRHLHTVADAVADEVDRLMGMAGQEVVSQDAMTRILHRALVRAFFGGRIDINQADQLSHSVGVVTEAVALRMLLPFIPAWFPLPGDRSLRRAVRAADAILFPLVRQYREEASDTQTPDLAYLLCAATDDNGRGLSDRRIRDDIMSIFAAGTETTSTALTWLWVVLDANPDIAARLYQEIDTVVGEGPARPEHLPDLRYTQMVLQELLRVYPIAWLLPRVAVDDDVIDGVHIRKGATVVLSPYLTHRLPDLWDDPETFDPERFSEARQAGRHRYAYFPFGGGIHQCLGSHLFGLEASLVLGTILSRFRPETDGTTPAPVPGAALRPDRPIAITLRPRQDRDLVPSSQ
ncbi:MAG TPA: cytochrome P450 [Micromonosporaceae bacterium]|nr:cytochrome P450 [Micromonosporaceae bacterium]